MLVPFSCRSYCHYLCISKPKPSGQLHTFKNIFRGFSKGVIRYRIRIDRRKDLYEDQAKISKSSFNWQVGIGVAKQGETGRIDGGGGTTIAGGRAILAGYSIGPRIIINNNVPYIVKLNNGSSAQAPIGFVEKAAIVAAVAAQIGSATRP